MTLPGLVMGVVISTFFGAAFHLWRGGNILRLGYYLLLAWIGFWCGHALAEWLGWTFLSLGPLRLSLAIPSLALFLGVGYWLSLFKPVSVD